MTVVTEPATAAEVAGAVAGGGGLPTHVAIIMDGNGRWAQKRHLPRAEGHRRGVEAVRRTVRAAAARGIRYLTIYSFSSENWRRPASEIADLMNLLKLFVRRDLSELHRANIRVRILGERTDLKTDIAALLDETESVTRDNTGLTLIVAFNYGSRQEIVRAARRLAEDVATGRIAPDAIDADAFAARLDLAGVPDPDLIIRTSGEQRLSSFLLWQAAYAELVFLPVLWPDFDEATFDEALAEFARRERRYGGLSASS